MFAFKEARVVPEMSLSLKRDWKGGRAMVPPIKAESYPNIADPIKAHIAKS
jgi:hypothetical protein